MRISVIATVLNEGQAIRILLDSLLAQTLQPHEVIIVDGGSDDDTVPTALSYAERLPLTVFVEPGCNISEGRNRAIRTSSGWLIASTDAGVRLTPDWLVELARPFEQQSTATQVVSGFFQADPQSLFEVALGATVLPTAEEVVAEKFLPSSRSIAFRRDAWEAVGGYPEWLDYCEDLIFDLDLRRRYGPFPIAIQAVAYFRPRRSMSAFFRQYYRYARGDGKADLWRNRHLVRYTTYLIALPGMLALSVGHHPAWLTLLAAGIAAYCWQPWKRLGRVGRILSVWQRVWAAALVPLIRLVGDVAKMIGYPVGWVWRWRNWRRREIHWRR